MRTHTHTAHTHTHTHACSCTHTHTHMHAHAHTRTHVLHTHTHTHTHACTHTHAHTHMHAHTHTCTHAHMYHTHTHTPLQVTCIHVPLLHTCNSSITFIGRSCMKQYVPKKPVRRGFKIWVLADSCNGYFVDTDVYVGKPGDGVTTEHGLGGRVVLQLTEALAGKKYHIYCDNFFTSPDLFSELESRQLYACGTVRSNRRGFPDQLQGVSLSRGKCCFRQKGNLVATVWQDKRQVTMLSTLCDGDATKPVKRREKDGTEVCVDCPQCIITYNNHMGGVDRGDQLRQYYRVRLKCRKYYKYIYWFYFDVSITNAFILYYNHVLTPALQKQQNLKKFRLAMATKLIGSYNGRMRRGRPPLSLPRARPHPPSADTPPAQRPRTAFNFPSHGKSRRCVYCGCFRTPPCRRESVWYCEDCEGCPTLCLTGCSNDCWRLWHTQ